MSIVNTIDSTPSLLMAAKTQRPDALYRGSSTRFIMVVLAMLMITVLAGNAEAAYRNVYGEELQPCSKPGMALTGFMRDGHCTDQKDDEGSHHVCIDIGSTTGGDFCRVTGQGDWCHSSMPCDGDTRATCPVRNWCVCQWAFAGYLERAGGCANIQKIDCEATNLEAVRAYRSSGKGLYDRALNCLVQRCGILVPVQQLEEITAAAFE